MKVCAKMAIIFTIKVPNDDHQLDLLVSASRFLRISELKLTHAYMIQAFRKTYNNLIEVLALKFYTTKPHIEL